MAITDYDQALGRMVTRTAVYPDILADYDTAVTWNGTIATSVNGSAQCLRRPIATTELFPSHPFLPVISASQTADSQDSKGWLYSPSWQDGGIYSDISTLFPGVEALSCSKSTQASAAPAQAVYTASFATVTSVCLGFWVTVSPSLYLPMMDIDFPYNWGTDRQSCHPKQQPSTSSKPTI